VPRFVALADLESARAEVAVELEPFAGEVNGDELG
jgi:hypothetical protein